MGKSCVYVPSVGQQLFKELRQSLGYETAKEVFLLGISPSFINDYKNTLSLDAEGIPTTKSLMNNEYIKLMLGPNRIAKSLESNYRNMEDSDTNYSTLCSQAYEFNNNTEYNNFVAIVEYKGQDKIGISIYPKTQQLEQKAKEQYAANKLNKFLSSEFQNLGVTIGTLSKAEMAAGRVGVTSFSRAKGIAQDFGSIVRIARTMEGAQALSEEWCHMIVGLFKSKNNPLVTRAIEVLSKDQNSLQEILGDDYYDTLYFHDNNMEKVAEEALGQLLQESFIKETIEIDIPSKALFNRTKNNILNQFKENDPYSIDNAIREAEATMSSIAKEILSGGVQFTQEDVSNIDREDEFNALSNRLERSLEVLKEAQYIEVKRKEVYEDGDIVTLSNIDNHITDDDKQVLEGILQYANDAVQRLKDIRRGFQRAPSLPSKQLFALLRKAQIYTDSYSNFIAKLSSYYRDAVKEDDDLILDSVIVDGQELNIKEMVEELKIHTSHITEEYVEIGIPAFAKILEPFLGENLTKSLQKKLDTENVVEYLLQRAPGDITMFDMWVDSMGDSSDVILQLFDALVKDIKDTERLKTIKEIREVMKLMKEAEDAGIKDFEYVFEKDNEGNKTGNYTSSVNQGQFLKDKLEFLDYLSDKYGKNPSGQDAIDMLAERDAWIEEHCHSKMRSDLPDLEFYKNNDFFNLSDSQKEILRKFKELKTIYDKKLPNGRMYQDKAIQRRKSGSQRFLDSLSSPTQIYEEAKGAIKDQLLDAVDDDAIYGDSRATRGLKGFDGKEFMSLPMLYTTRLENPNELSTDIFGSLCSYIHMANRYEAMSEALNTLEVGSTIIQNRQVSETRDGSTVKERLKHAGEVITSIINKGETNQAEKVRSYMRSQVYQRYMKDHGSTGKFSNTKMANFLLKLGSMATMSFNWLADAANVANAVALTNIEAMSQEYFSPGDLLRADTEYTAAMANYIPELGTRIKTNKLWLVDELLEIRQDFNEQIQRKLKRSLAERVLGKNWGSLGQSAGNHWLMNRVAIAYMNNIKVKVPGKEVMSLWDALEVQDTSEDNNIKIAGLPEGTTLENGEEVNLKKIGREIDQINQSLLGNYNIDDATKANQVALGRAVLQYRKWMKPILNARFQPRRENVLMDKQIEGFYITAFDFAKNLIRAKFQIGQVMSELDDMQKKNLMRFMTELLQLGLVWALVNLVDWPDDEDRPWAVKFAQYMATRELKELAGITPFGVREMGKVIEQPFPVYKQIDGMVTLLYSILSPEDYYTEVQSGPYKGFTVLEKNILKAPIPGAAQWKQIEKFGTGIEESMKWYLKP